MKKEPQYLNEKRTLEELDVIDDFLFTELMTNKQYRKEFADYFLKTVLGQEVVVREINVQAIATPGNRHNRGIRMDVKTEASLQKPVIALAGSARTGREATVDIEMQSRNSQLDEGQKHDIRRRSRLYQSLIDANMLPAGGDFGVMNDVLVIICIPFDLFGDNRLKYTFESVCLENTDIRLNDGAQRIFLNTRGEVGDFGELGVMLRYLEHSTRTNAVSTGLKRIHKMITEVKGAEEARKRFMWAIERENMIREEGQEEGKKEGIQLAKGVLKHYHAGLTEQEIADKLALPLENVREILAD